MLRCTERFNSSVEGLSCISIVLVTIFTTFIFTTRSKMVILFFMHAKKAYGGQELSNPHPGYFTPGKTVPH
jgi:hypothetical protein